MILRDFAIVVSFNTQRFDVAMLNTNEISDFDIALKKIIEYKN